MFEKILVKIIPSIFWAIVIYGLIGLIKLQSKLPL